MNDLYQELGIERGADAATIKAAYRKLAQKAHPDRAGGDKALFQRIQQAYDVLSDPDKRAEYDATGKVPGQGPTLRDEAMSVIVQAMKQALGSKDPVHDNILRVTEQIIDNTSRELAERMHELERNLDKVRKAMKRSSAAAGKEDAISPVMLHLEAELVGPIGKMDLGCKAMKLAIEILKDHSYKVDLRPTVDLHNQMNAQAAQASWFRF